LAAAEPLYHQILTKDPGHADALHLLGVLAHQVGRNDAAIRLIAAAIARDRRKAPYHSNLGAALQALGRLEEAADCYQRALALAPGMAEARMNLGAVLEAQGKPEQAEAHLRQALALRPDLAEAHVNLGNILQAQGKLEEAVRCHAQALALRPELAEASFNLANALQAQGKLEAAVVFYQRTLAIKPGMALCHGNLGNTLLAQGKLEEAETCFEQSLDLNPGYGAAWYNRGNLRQAQNKPEEAAVFYERAIALDPRLPEAHYNLGITLHSLDGLEEAAASFERALALRPHYAEAHYNLSCVLEELGSSDEALRAIARAIEIKPDYPQARFGHALAQLRRGDYHSGWRDYELRWQSPDHDTPRRSYPQPLWRGEKLAAETQPARLLLWGEQGVGDEIMFAGLIPDAIRRGNRITLDCDRRLLPLFARSFPEIEVVSSCSLAEAHSARFAAQSPTGSLPGIFRACESAFSATTSPYLKADPEERQQFRACYNDGRRLVGVAWQTRNQRTGRKRSIQMETLAPLFALSGIRWISLQYGDFDALEEQTAAANAPLLIDRTVDQFANLDRFAAQVAAMDQIITIDNSTAHLAGALGITTALLLPFAADWRWLLNRPESPWYPTLHLFRQPRPGDWPSVLEAIQSAGAF
jgi:tetratricopeptide (TPR) repeat protein